MDVGDSTWVIPDPAVAAEVSHRVDKRLAAVGPNGDQLVDVADVSKKVPVSEDVYGGLVVENHPESVEGVVGFGLAEVVSLVALAPGAYPAVRMGDPVWDRDIDEMFLEIAGDDAFGLVAGLHAKVGAVYVETPCHVQGAICRWPPCVEFMVHGPGHNS